MGWSTSSASAIARCVASALDHAGAGPGVVFRRRSPVGEQRLGPPVDRLVVLAMHRDQRAGPPGGREHAQIGAVVEMQRIVGEEHLQASHTLRDHVRDLAPHHVVGCVGDDLVEAMVDHRPRLGPAAIFGERREQASALELRGEADDGGGAAGQAGGAAGRPALFVGPAADLKLLDMAVRVDAAGEHEQAARIERLGSLEILADRGDPAGADADIGAECVRPGHNRPAAHDEVEGAACCHARPLCQPVPGVPQFPRPRKFAASPIGRPCASPTRPSAPSPALSR